MSIRGAGGGGKGGGSGGGISEEPDTLQSVANAKFIDLIGEGPMVGLVNGEYSIYVDGVSLRDLAGTPNYKPFQWAATTGTKTQLPIPGFAGTQQENAVSLKLLQTQGKIIRSVPDPDADSVNVTVSVQGLSQTTDDGKIQGCDVSYKIWVRVVGGSWVIGFNGSIVGKTNSKYQRSHEIGLKNLGPGPYEVAVERIKEDSASALTVDSLYWDSYTVINYEQLSYPYSALVAVRLDARYFSQVPSRHYHVKGLLVRVPTNYDPVSRKYTGDWDGQWKTAYSNNPAWCFFDLATNPRYGLGERLTDAQVNKWEIYQIAKYCDQMVPSGITGNVLDVTGGGGFSSGGKPLPAVPQQRGSLEPRFTLNVVINTRDDAYKVLNNLASVFRGMVYWSSGVAMVTQDRPTVESMIWTNANVVDGLFNYQGSSRAQRHTTAAVGWNDPKEAFRQKFEYIEDRAGIARYGVRPLEVVAFGCTSRSQARRTGLWLLYTERLEKEAITFKAALDSARVKPGDVGKIQDNRRAGARWGGRLLGCTTTVATLDAPVDLDVGTYTLSVMLPDGTIASKSVTIATAGSRSTLTVSPAFTTLPTDMAIWTLSSDFVTEMLVRVITVKPVGPNLFEISALEHEPSKYDAVELGMAVEESNYSFLTYNEVQPVESLTVKENSFKKTVTSPVQSNIEISWDQQIDPMTRGYTVKITKSSSSKTYPEQSEPFLTVENVAPGSYTVTVTAVNAFGIKGKAVSKPLTVTGVDSTPPADVTGFDAIHDQANGVTLFWTPVPDYVDYYEIRKGSSWGSSAFVDKVKAASKFIGPMPAGTHKYLIKAVDTAGNPSVNAASVSETIELASAPAVSFAISGPDEVLTWTIPASPFGIDAYEVWLGDPLAGGTLVTTVKATSLRRKVTYTGSRVYYVRAIDVTKTPGNAGSVSVTITEPGVVTSTRSSVVDNNALLYWASPASGSLPVERYEVRRGDTWEAGVEVGSNGNSTFTTVFEQQSGVYKYWIAAFDSAGNVGTPVAIMATINQPPDYILRASIDSTFSGALTNMYVENGALIGPVASQTAEQHFTTNGWATPQDQINAGYPLYAEPSTTSGSYDETIDYGAVLPATNVMVTVGSTVLDGAVSVACQIYYKAAAGDPWTAAAAGNSVLASNFRYVRVVLTFTSTAGANLIKVSSINYKLSAKLKTDNGSGTANAADASGTAVTFGVSFIDVSSINVTPSGTAARFAIYNFVDVPNPTSFKVLLFDENGNRVSGDFSWTARGY